MIKKLKNIFVTGSISTDQIAESILAHQSKTTIGAHSIFLGQIRADEIDGKNVCAIEYTANSELALQQMAVIRENLFNKYELTCIHVYHSLGRVNSGEICLFVFVSSKHRKTAIAACEELVEQIKQGLAIWGKEIFADSSYQWKENN